MTLTRAARAAAAAAAAGSAHDSSQSVDDCHTQDMDGAKRPSSDRGRSNRGSTRGSSHNGRDTPQSISSNSDSSQDNSSTNMNPSCSANLMEVVHNGSNTIEDRGDLGRRDRSSNVSERQISSTASSNSKVNSKKESPKAAAIAVPRVSLSLLRHRHPSIPTDPTKQREEAKGSIPAAFRRLTLGSEAPKPLLKPISGISGAKPDGTATQEKTFLDTTAAPGVVTLRALKPAGTLSCNSSSRSSKCKAPAWKDEGPPIRDASKIIAAVAAGEEPPRATDAALQHWSRRDHLLSVTDVQELRKEERERKKEKEKKALTKWFGMPLTEISPQMLRELRVLQLRGHAGSKTFGAKTKGSLVPIQKEKKKDGGPPTHTAYLQVARVVDGGLRGVGGGQESQAAGTSNKGPGRRGGASSLLYSMLNDPEVHRWTKRKYRELQERNNNRHSASWRGRNKKKKNT